MAPETAPETAPATTPATAPATVPATAPDLAPETALDKSGGGSKELSERSMLIASGMSGDLRRASCMRNLCTCLASV